MRGAGGAFAALTLGLAGLLSASGRAATRRGRPIRSGSSCHFRPAAPRTRLLGAYNRCSRLTSRCRSLSRTALAHRVRWHASGRRIAARRNDFSSRVRHHAVNPSVLPNLPYDTLKDLAPVMLIGTSPMVITSQHAPGPASGELGETVPSCLARITRTNPSTATA